MTHHAQYFIPAGEVLFFGAMLECIYDGCGAVLKWMWGSVRVWDFHCHQSRKSVYQASTTNFQILEKTILYDVVSMIINVDHPVKL